MSEHVEVERDGPLLVLRLARPKKRNAVTSAMYAALADSLEAADGDMSVRAVVILGSGGTFTAGNDIGDFLDNPPVGHDAPVLRFLRALAAATVPIVAGVEGDAVGIGATMLLHCDAVLVTPSARLRMPFVDLGIVPEAASTYLLPKIMGHLRAAELLLLAEGFDGERAVELGLASRVVPDDELACEAMAAARRFAAKPPHAMRETKRLMKADRPATEAAMDAEARLFAERLASTEAREAFIAFMEKRPADFSKL